MLEKIVRFLIKRKVFSFFLMISLFAAGIYAALLLPRESSPEVNAPFVVVSTGYNGAKALDIENEITTKLEDELETLKDVKVITSTSSDNASSIVIEFDQEVDIDIKEDEVEKKINKVKSVLPEDATDPSVFKIEVSNDPVYVFSISSTDNDYIFKKNLDNVKEKIENLPGVSEVSFTGSSDYQYSLYLDNQKAQSLGLSPLQVYNAIRSADSSVPVGSLKVSNIEYPLEINSQIKAIEDLETIVVAKKDDSLVYLRDISTIKKEFKEESNFSTTFTKEVGEKKRSSVFYVKKEQGYNVEEVVDTVKEFLATEGRWNAEEDLDNGENFLKKENITVLVDWGQLVKDDLWNLSKNGLITTFLVFLLLLFILGLKDSLIAAFAIPFSFVLAFIAFLITGNTLNFISLFSLILSIGILVDSDIVISEGIEKRRKEGMSENEASIQAVKDLAIPMIAGTLTTVAVFAPLMFLSGITGEFIRSIPFTVIFVILASQLVSIFVIPVLHATNYSRFIAFLKWLLVFIIQFVILNSFLKVLAGEAAWKGLILTFLIIILSALGTYFLWKRSQKREKTIFQVIRKKVDFKFFDDEENTQNRKTFFEWLESVYEKAIGNVLKSTWKKIVLILTAFAAFVFAVFLPASGAIKFEFFPGGDVLFINVDIEMTEGAVKAETKEYISQVEDLLIQEENITDMISTVGETGSFASSQSNGERYGNIFLKITDEAQKNGQIYTEELQARIEEAGLLYAEAKKSEDGPPGGAPISFNILGSSQELVEKYAVEAEKILSETEGVINIKSDIDKLQTSFKIEIDKAKAKMLGVSEQDISMTIRASTEGLEILDVYDPFVEEDVKVVFLNNEMLALNKKDFDTFSPEDLLNLRVKNNQGQDVFLGEIVTISLAKYQSNIFHYDGKNSLKIEAENTTEANLNDLVADFKEKFAVVNNAEEVEIVFGGAFSEQQQNFMETFVIFIIGILIVFAILIFYFNSIWLPTLIESVIIFAYTGSTIGLWITGNAISFPSMIGLIALSGVVVNNSIMLIHNYQDSVKKFFSRRKLSKNQSESNIKNNLKEGVVVISEEEKAKMIIKGSSDRLRPILLTVLTTTIGLAPLIFSSPVWAPIVFVIIFGLIFSTFITLFFIPVVYYWTFNLFTKNK